MKKSFTFIALLIFFSLNPHCSSAQSECLETMEYQTINLGDGNDFIPFPLTFKFSKDSLSVFPTSAQGESFMSFIILQKKCKWKNNFADGKSEYDLKLIDSKKNENAKLSVVKENGKGKITLLYSGTNEARVFEMQ